MVTEITKDQAVALINGVNWDDYEYVTEEFIDHRRWNLNYLIVFEYQGSHYGFVYDRPATEYQESEVLYNETIKVYPVHQVPKTKWEFVE